MNESQPMTASYTKTDTLANKILSLLQSESASVGYGMLSAALVLGRLVNNGDVLKDEIEVKWLEDCLDYANLYFTETAEGQKDS